MKLFAEHRLHRVPAAVARALVAWARGERLVDLLYRVPTPREVVALQARGRRCVSLLDDGIPTAPHADGLAFAFHDLCHLEKFVDPEHYEAQIGFSWLVSRAMDKPGWAELERDFDPLWEADRDHVIADMNGSAVFLLLALKSKLKIAVRRRFARARGDERAAYGPLDPEEQKAWELAQDALFELLELRGPIGDAARALSEKGSAPGAMVTLGEHLRALGSDLPIDRAHPPDVMDSLDIPEHFGSPSSSSDRWAVSVDSAGPIDR